MSSISSMASTFQTLVEPHVRSSCRFVVPLLRVCCFLLAFDLLAPGTSMSAMLGLHILESSCKDLVQAWVPACSYARRAKAQAGLWQRRFGRVKAVFFHHFRPETCSMKGLPDLMPGGHKRRRVKRRHFNHRIVLLWVPMKKGHFSQFIPDWLPIPNWRFHSKMAPFHGWMKLIEIALFHGNPPSKSKAKGWGIGLYIRLLGVGHLRNLARSSTNRDGFASKILESGPWWPAVMPKMREIGQIGCHNVFRTSCLLVWSRLSQQWL